VCGFGRWRGAWSNIWYLLLGIPTVAAILTAVCTGVNHHAFIRGDFADNFFFLQRFLGTHLSALGWNVVAILDISAWIAAFIAAIFASRFFAAFLIARFTAFAAMQRAARQRSAKILAFNYPNGFFDFLHFAYYAAILFAAGMAAAMGTTIHRAAGLHFATNGRWIASLCGNRAVGNQHHNRQG
jgi:hypothetical protein